MFVAVFVAGCMEDAPAAPGEPGLTEYAVVNGGDDSGAVQGAEPRGLSMDRPADVGEWVNATTHKRFIRWDPPVEGLSWVVLEVDPHTIPNGTHFYAAFPERRILHEGQTHVAVPASQNWYHEAHGRARGDDAFVLRVGVDIPELPRELHWWIVTADAFT